MCTSSLSAHRLFSLEKSSRNSPPSYEAVSQGNQLNTEDILGDTLMPIYVPHSDKYITNYMANFYIKQFLFKDYIELIT